MADQKAVKDVSVERPREYEDRAHAETGEQDADDMYRRHGRAIRKDAASEAMPVDESDAPESEGGAEKQNSGPFPVNGPQTDTGKSAHG